MQQERPRSPIDSFKAADIIETAETSAMPDVPNENAETSTMVELGRNVTHGRHSE